MELLRSDQITGFVDIFATGIGFNPGFLARVVEHPSLEVLYFQISRKITSQPGMRARATVLVEWNPSLNSEFSIMMIF